MLSNYLENLQNSIVWAQTEDDINVLCAARDQLDQLLSFVSTLPQPDQIHAHLHIDKVLPMEWPLWMEACRYEDGGQYECRELTLH
jgi:hypothetical protein